MMKIFLRKAVPLLLLAAIALGSGGCTKNFRIKRMLKKANNDFSDHYYDKAEIEFKNVLQMERLNPTAIGQLGRLYGREARWIDARMYLTEAVRLEPNNILFELALGQSVLAFHDSTNAFRIGVTILKAEPTNEEALLLVNECPVPPRQMQEILDTFPNISQNRAFHIAQGTVHLREKQYPQAEAEFRQALVVNPKSSDAYFAMAVLYLMQKDGKDAAAALKTAAEKASYHSPIRAKYADFLIQQGDTAAAWAFLKDLRENAPFYMPGWVASMNLALAEKKYDEAGKYADEIMARDDHNYDGFLGEGTVSLAKGDPAKALGQFQRMETMYKHSPQVKYEMAMAYLMSKDRIKAVANLNQALAMDPNYPQAVLLLAQLDIRGSDPSTAIPLLTKFIKKEPKVLQAQFLLADAYVALQKPDSAVAAYHNMAAAEPKNAQIPLMAGIILAEEGKNSAARAEFEKSIALAPQSTTPVDQLINLDLLEHNYRDATQLVQAQIAKNPKAAEPWELQAKIDVARTNLDQAATDLLKAINLNADLVQPYLLLADVYVRGHKETEALQKLNSLVARTNDVSALLQIGAIHDHLKQFDQASDAYERALKANPKSIPALNNLAYLDVTHLNKIDRAYELAQQARELMPYSPNVADTLGWVLYKKGDYPRALPLLQDAVSQTPSDGEIQYHLGMTHYMIGDENAAGLALRRAITSSQDYPGKEDARAHYAILSAGTGASGPAALASLEKLLQEHPDDPVILNRMAEMQEASGDAEKAAATYEKALKQNPSAVHIMARLARLYGTRLNQPDKARTLADAAHKLAPDNPEVSGVLGRMVFRSGDFTWSLSLLENAADRLPDQPELQHDLAWAYYANGRIDDAKAAMEKSLQLNKPFMESDDAKQFLTLVDAYGSAGKFQAANALAQKVLQSDAKNVPALMVVGAADEQAGNFKAAQDAYGKACNTYPQFVPASRELAILDSKHFPDDSKGLTAGEKARGAYRSDSAVTKALGILAYTQGKYSRSAEVLQDGVSRDGNDAEMYFYLGMDFSRLKQAKQSKQALERAVSLKLPDNLAAQAKETLAGLK